MANNADSSYRFFGSEETLNKLMNTIKCGDRLCTIIDNLGGNSDGYIRGEVYWIDREDNHVWVEADTAWDEQPDFIMRMREIFKGDEEFRIEWQCEEPGCRVYRTNVHGAHYGEFLGVIDYEEEYFDTDTEVISYFTQWAEDEGIEHPEWKDFDDMQDWLDQWSGDTKDDRDAHAYHFEIISE